MAKGKPKQRSPLSIRLPEGDERRYEGIAEQIGISLPDWIRETLAARAKQVEEWIEADLCFRDGTGRLQFTEELPTADREKLRKLLK